ncbi:hypothetical protein, partial [Vibrio anguillarum]|uniref:hypothetical protein n=1 Tax=Vibrio anguillarum TaxID=55601 RepID=UPI001BE458D4
PRVVNGDAVISMRSNFTVGSEDTSSELQPVNSINRGNTISANKPLKNLVIIRPTLEVEAESWGW